ncbi:MAG TPA: hypothetical protein VER08_01260, partial [Pyrinomonadaceae bacterium]|nr:hypothetical protein [Pyrinomonadaceae bacterium]
ELETAVPGGAPAVGGTPPPQFPAATPPAYASHAGQFPAAAPPPPFAPARTTGPVVGNQSLMLYHLPDCRWVGKIAPKNRLEFASPAAAQVAGLRPCKVCAP